MSDCETIMCSLEHRFPQASLFLLTDTSFSDCCSDFVAAAHVQADAVIKFGPSCTFPGTEAIPLYVVSWTPTLANFHDTGFIDLNGRVILVGDYSHGLGNGRFEFQTWQSIDISRPEVDVQVISYLQEPWVGELLCLLMPQNRVFQCSQGYDLTELSCVRVKSRRWRILDSLGPSTIYGIVVHSSLQCVSPVARALGELLLSKGGQYYIINAGVLTPTKLGNYPDIDVFVVVGCSKLCFTAHEFFKPLITCFELLCHLGLLDFWKDSYTIDIARIESTISSLNKTHMKENREQALALHTEYSLQLLQHKRLQDVPSKLDNLSQQVSIQNGAFGIPRSYTRMDGMSETIKK